MKRVRLRLFLAIAAVWVLWGSTYAGMHVALGSLPPFAMAAMRFTVAGLILWVIAAAFGEGRPSLATVRNALITGALLLLLGNGVMAWTVQFLPTGLNALLVSVAPIWMAAIDFAWKRRVPTRMAMIGMALGLIGMAVLLGPRSSASFPLVPAAIAVLGSVAWALGSIYQRYVVAEAPMLATALQMFFGGLLLAIEAALTGQWQQVHLATVTPAAWLALAWLVVCGSLIGYSAYLYTIRHAPTALASTYAYVNPLVAVVLGIVLFHERLTVLEGVAGAIIVAGVALMMVPSRGVATVAPLATFAARETY